MLQASTVCRDLAEAALYVIRSMDGLDICCSYYPNNYWVQLDSRLLLEWAPLISGCVRLHGNSILTPGLPAFCEAGAGTMHSLHVSTYADLPHAHLPYQFDVSLGLPELRVNLEIDLDDWTFLNLNWLQFQPRIVLTVILRINTDLVTKHEHATRELRHTPLHNLTMIWQVPLFSEEVPSMWRLLYVQECLTVQIDFCEDNSLQVLQALPRCGNICIRTSIPFAQIELDWAAVTSQAARISLCMPSAILSILGGFSIPDDLGGAWQLTVHEADSVNGQGLQGACVIGTDHILQNAAAVAAGWTVDGVEVRDHAAQPCLACALHACCLGVI